MTQNSQNSGGGIGFIGLLTLLLIALKLLGRLGWSWFWVLAPIWVGFLLGLLVVVVACVVYVLMD
jgi:hypothetical protein